MNSLILDRQKTEAKMKPLLRAWSAFLIAIGNHQQRKYRTQKEKM